MRSLDVHNDFRLVDIRSERGLSRKRGKLRAFYIWLHKSYHMFFFSCIPKTKLFRLLVDRLQVTIKYLKGKRQVELNDFSPSGTFVCIEAKDQRPSQQIFATARNLMPKLVL